tara:strand:- start:12 stop:500 length:489 start_codon:yes stop_codon:yes gene_type:complete
MRKLGLSTLLGAVLFSGLSLVQSGCGEEIRCNGFLASESTNAPEITRIEKLKQMPGDPWTIIMSLYFIDRDGDLASGDGDDTGVMNFFLNGGLEASAQSMETVFEQSALGSGETNGNAWFAIRFDDASTPDGARVNFETQLVDGSGNRSNCYVVNLTFDVTE